MSLVKSIFEVRGFDDHFLSIDKLMLRVNEVVGTVHLEGKPKPCHQISVVLTCYASAKFRLYVSAGYVPEILTPKVALTWDLPSPRYICQSPFKTSGNGYFIGEDQFHQ